MLTEKTETQRSKRGMRNVMLVILAAGLIMGPSYLASIMASRLNIDISILAIMSLAIFLLGVFVLVKLLKD